MDSQHIKVSERLLKSTRQSFCHIFYHSQMKSARKISFSGI